ncbi:MAG TPA: hypothetical protein VMX55_09665 [candidate division Zixibacteria bacterium]|nr:hypothetical protein [candidate division Zixibacteria bacterium]
MKELFYRFKSRQVQLLKVILVVSLITFSSYVIILLPQLGNPHIINKYVSRLMSGSRDIEAEKYHTIDFSLSGVTSSENVMKNFDQILNTTSQNAFGLFDPIDYNFFLSKVFEIDNQISKMGLVLGVKDSIYNSLLDHYFNTSFSGGILLTDIQNDTTGIYTLTIDKKNITLPINGIIDRNSFSLYFSNFSYFLSNNHFYTRFIFLPLEGFISVIEDIYLTPSNYRYGFKMYINFSEYQEDILYWSINSDSMISRFKKEIKTELLQIDTSIIIHLFIDHLSLDNSLIVNIVFSVIRTLQFIIWGISFFVVIFSFSKLQKSNLNRELFNLISGQTWSKRIATLLLETLFIVLISSVISLLIIYPFIQLQILFNFSFTFEIGLILDFLLFTGLLFVVIFSVFLDFEFYLQRIIKNGMSKEEEYRPFKKIPIYLKIFSFLSIFLILWLLNRSLQSLLYFAAIILGSALITLLILGIVRLIQFISGKIIYNYRLNKDKPLTPTMNLFKIWKKIFNTRMIFFSLIFSLTCTAFIISYFVVDAGRTQYIWFSGSEISVDISNNNNLLEIDDQLNSYVDISDYTKTVMTSGFFNNTDDYYHFELSGNNITPAKGSSFGTIDFIIGINKTDYYHFFNSWDKKNWLEEGNLNDFNENKIFVSKDFKNKGFSENDNLYFFNSTNNLIINDFVNIWPTITDQQGIDSEEKLFLIVDLNFLQTILDSNNISYWVTYSIHTPEEKIETTVNFVISTFNEYNTIEEMRYLDPSLFQGLTKVFLHPLIVFLEVMIFIWSAIFIQTNISDKYSSFEMKTLGLIAISHNYKKSLIKFKLTEILIQIPIFIVMMVILFYITYGLVSIAGIIYNINVVSVSKQTYLNLVYILIIFSSLLIVQMLIDLFNYRKLNISLIYRHPE